ncbi:MAG: hypothetical protein EOS23_00300 [Mesorhizobium sp.]|uniref:hypothetical protein n=1 Tax=unclassified Mesorhizobium TaxID=325217 RepID=UPI000FD48AE4|nr:MULTISPECIES: hypothetical protein [unclassified Mesorhizobium]RUV81404.1 hypothetical protein EOA88_19985 [Mesorhizobium sp. M5C.F.Ca.IN.020.14.1.1]RWC42365.1 MAG: hypothetical protein EOS28_16375 [Mesorhizobium sp.]RWE13688.1 MAG: hypothetical protein EOS23_00300 [Mesorhizobium sp.]RWF05274.1 MAG: hypothetical protein EOS68_01010 [Mesorhizobium sp.]RWG48673.1 MAG: hypothetical protein EOQ62_08795 [Mesorhizobium sp.]
MRRLRQVRGKPEAGDMISSHALRQAAFSRDSIEAVRDAQPASLPYHIPGLPSKQWSSYDLVLFLDRLKNLRLLPSADLPDGAPAISLPV